MKTELCAFALFTAALSAAQPPGYTNPLIDLAAEEFRQVIVDREPGQYLGHPTTVLLEDGSTMLAVYPMGHGQGSIVMKRSNDGGWTWSQRLEVPESWKTSKETPTIHKTIDAVGVKRLILWSGLYPARLAVAELSKERQESWTDLKPVGDWGGIVVMSSVVPLNTGSGHYMAMFHDDGRFLQAAPQQQNPPVFTLYKTFSRDGGLTWSYPEAIFSRADIHLCEPGAIRSPDGKQLAVLLRENSRRMNSHVIFSDDEGATWSEPRELPGALTGDRHVGRYTPDGRLFISFRDTTRESPTQGDWVAWVGRYEDIVQGREGQYRVRLMDNKKGADCGYPGVEVLPNGAVVTTTYGHWQEGEAPYIVSVHLTMDELDARAQVAAPENAASKAARERAEAVAAQLKSFPMQALLFDQWEPLEKATDEIRESVRLLHEYVEAERSTENAALAPLLRHSKAYVRALAIAALFHREDPHACPLIATCLDDKTTIPAKDDSRSIGSMAGTLLAAYFNASPVSLDSLRGEQFLRYWEAHHQRSHCAGWFRLRLGRAKGDARIFFAQPPKDRTANFQRVVQDLERLSPLDRALTLWYMWQPFGEQFPTKEELIRAFKDVPVEQVIALMRGERLSDDPDLEPREINFNRLAPPPNLSSWLFESAPQILPKSAAVNLAAEYDRAITAKEDERVGLFTLEKWLTAASRLDPERFTESLKQTMVGGPDAVAALWSARGMAERDTILQWLFDPEASNKPTLSDELTWGADFLRDVRLGNRPDSRELVHAAVLHPRFPFLDRTTLWQLRAIVDQLHGRELDSSPLPSDRVGGDPELAVTMAEWRNGLRSEFGLEPEKVPELPRVWRTLRSPIKRYRLPEDGAVILDGARDKVAHPTGDALQVRDLVTNTELLSLSTPNFRPRLYLPTTFLSGALLVVQTDGQNGVGIADFDRKTLRVVQPKPEAAYDYVRAARVDPTGARLLIQTSDDLALFRIPDGNRLWTRRSFSFADLLVFIDGGKRIAFAPDNDSVLIIDSSNGEDIQRLDAHAGGLNTMLASADGQRLVTYGFDGRINVWDAHQLALIRTIFTFAPVLPRAPAALSADGRTLALAPEHANTVLVYDLERAIFVGEVRLNTSKDFYDLGLSANGSHLAATTNDQGWLSVWDLTPLIAP